MCRPEVYICDIQDTASEIIESYEYENEPLKAIEMTMVIVLEVIKYIPENHFMHILNIHTQFKNQKINEDDVFAIEFFSTNGDTFPTILNSSDTLNIIILW